MDAIGINLPGLITQLVSFLILFFILSKLLYGPISKALDERSNRIKESLEAADRARQDAASSAERVEQEIAEARTQGQQLIAEAREAAGRLRTSEEERVRADLEALRQRATQDVQRERDGAIEEIRAEFANLAVDAAERVIGRSLDAQAHREIIEGVLQEGLAKDGGDS
ncbi:MAG: F0F1 ATP synthase subunit B [Chloroflexi bacterium]|jgi:F-type H+-transporting ATPase subunit b|nr:F0F1 ATP synthase subunit B [Chloroflexota bacterium]MBT4073480.1 F0F1 ATP synthase subunit B [Chloroflexota bacterium]MBT4513982.1 F0F1 ATP synthase subunit B [Chloroflexota bacterium]MBT5318369.1 F0F1 ATP synthase subunit B [Chloroflexota bacterium]MBT6680454.1 F0F1 ATP synthase subunit B [Chloroflexota bacterium]